MPHVGRDDGSGSERVLAKRDAADDRRIRADRAAALHECAPDSFLRGTWLRGFMTFVKTARWPAEDVVFHSTPLVVDTFFWILTLLPILVPA